METNDLIKLLLSIDVVFSINYTSLVPQYVLPFPSPQFKLTESYKVKVVVAVLTPIIKVKVLGMALEA